MSRACCSEVLRHDRRGLPPIGRQHVAGQAACVESCRFQRLQQDATPQDERTPQYERSHATELARAPLAHAGALFLKIYPGSLEQMTGPEVAVDRCGTLAPRKPATTTGRPMQKPSTAPPDRQPSGIRSIPPCRPGMPATVADPAARPAKRKAAQGLLHSDCTARPTAAAADGKRQRAADTGQTGKNMDLSASGPSTATAAAGVPQQLLLRRKRGRPRQVVPPAGNTQSVPASVGSGSTYTDTPRPLYNGSPVGTYLLPTACQQPPTPQPPTPQQQPPGAQPAARECLGPAMVAQKPQQPAPLILRGLTCDMHGLAALLQQQAAPAAPCSGAMPAAASGSDVGQALPVLWRQAQVAALQHSLQLLVQGLEAMPPPPTDQVRPAEVCAARPTLGRRLVARAVPSEHSSAAGRQLGTEEGQPLISSVTRPLTRRPCPLPFPAGQADGRGVVCGAHREPAGRGGRHAAPAAPG